jgi:hypothetical protein
MFETMKKNPIPALIVLALVIAGGVWLYIWSTDPLNQTCRDVNEDPHGFGIRAADAIYDDLSERARAKTTREVTRMHVVTFCSINDPKKSLSAMRDQIERDATGESP